jgi:lysozyme
MRILSAIACCTAASCVVGDGMDDLKAGGALSPADTSSGSGTIEPYARVCASGQTTFGVDVSKYNTSIDWARAKAAGVAFAFVRVSDGTAHPDPRFASYWAGAKAAGIVRGAYQLIRPDVGVAAQADLLIRALGNTYTPGDLPPVIDVEVTDGLGPHAVASFVNAWVARVKAALGVDPIVYTGKYFWRDQVGGDAALAGNPLWVAQYTTQCPDLPAPWTKWTFWQYYDKGRVDGIVGDVDMDRFDGSIDQLRAIAGSSSGSGSGSGSSGSTCQSSTLDAAVDDGACVQSATDAMWYQCTAGTWTSVASTAGCTTTFGWCASATLGSDVPPRTCVQARSDGQWYQCDGHHWAQPVDTTAFTGPAGACASEHPL